MKKVLFATTALVMTAGVAAAEVSLSGDGRFGIVYDGDDAQFSSRARVTFRLSGETDGGLAFGGAFRADQESNYTDTYPNRSAGKGTRGSVYIQGEFGRLTVGDVVSASENIIGDLVALGYTNGAFANDQEEWSYLTGDGANRNQGPIALYTYSVGGFSFAASFSDGKYGNPDNDTRFGGTGVGTWLPPGVTDPSDADVAYSIAAGYEFGDYSIGLGYADNGTASEIGIGGTATFGDFSFKAAYFDYSDRFVGTDEFRKAYGISADYTFGATTISALAKRDEYASDDYDTYGIGASYDLGGGATLAAGIIDTDYLDDTVYDFGIKFSF